jgi:hypothetical protein
MLFSFLRSSICPGAALDYVPQRWVGELCLFHIVQLLILQVYAGSFETGQQIEMVCHFSQVIYFLGLVSVPWGTGRLSKCYGFRILQSKVLVDALSSAY